MVSRPVDDIFYFSITFYASVRPKYRLRSNLVLLKIRLQRETQRAYSRGHGENNEQCVSDLANMEHLAEDGEECRQLLKWPLTLRIYYKRLKC